jgi:hypothetical protein
MNDQSNISFLDSLSEEAQRLKRERFTAVALLLIAVLATTTYAMLRNPFINTFSRIGNYYGYRWLYIVWAVMISFCIHSSTLLLFKLTAYPRKWGYIALALSSFFLIITAIIPSIKEELLFWHRLHKWTTFFYVMSMLTAQHPFFVWLARKIPRIKKLLRNWQLIILIGSMSSLIIQGQTGIFELWFFLGLGTLLIYLAWILFTEKIDEIETNERKQEKER